MSAMRSAGRGGGLMTVAAALVVALWSGVASSDRALAAGQPAAPRPNVVLILADDMGYGDLGVYGATDMKTPNLDRLAAEGVRLTDFYANAPVCTPTRAGLITGRYQQRVMMERPLSSAGTDLESGLPATGRSLPRLLADAGYDTGAHRQVAPGLQARGRPARARLRLLLGLPVRLHRLVHTRPAATARPTCGRTSRRSPPRATSTTRSPARGPVHRAARGRGRSSSTSPTARRTGRSSRRPRRRWRVGEQLDDAAPLGRRGTEPRGTTSRSWRTSTAGSGACSTALSAHGLAQNTLVIFMSDNGGEWLSRNDPLFNRKDTSGRAASACRRILRWPGRCRRTGFRARSASRWT